jgi:DNA-binding MarR family transcriptional regulator
MPAPHGQPSLDFLLNQVCHLHDTRLHQLLERLGLYRGQPPVLLALAEQEGLTHSEMAARLGNTPATTTKMLQRMEKAGFITRQPDPADLRVSRVYLTEAGRAVQCSLDDVLAQVDAETFAGLSEAEREHLYPVFERIRDNLFACMEERSPR